MTVPVELRVPEGHRTRAGLVLVGVPLLLEPVVRRVVVPAQGAPVEPAR
nr:hypothetical protein [Streptomyces sp. NRRL S-37]